MGAGGHDPPFGADNLSRLQLPASGTVGTAGFYGRLKQLYNGSPLSAKLILPPLYYTTPSFSTVFLYHIDG